MKRESKQTFMHSIIENTPLPSDEEELEIKLITPLTSQERGAEGKAGGVLMGNEEPLVRHIYATLPYQGSEEERLACLELLYKHSRDVADLALQFAARHPEMHLDTTFVQRAALLHDIGIIWTNAPSIHCHGTQPYIRHGELGAAFLNNLGLSLCANVAKRHTGTGITDQEIEQQGIPITPGAMPITLEEKLICYADKFYSKSHPEQRKTLEQARHSLQKFGQQSLQRFDQLTELFG